MSLTEKLTSIKTNLDNAMSDINTALVAKGASEVTTLADVPTAIESVEGGSEPSSPPWLDTGGMNSLIYFFSRERNANIPVTTLNTDNVLEFSHMYRLNTTVNTIPYFNTKNGYEFSYMFGQATALKQIELLDVSNGTNFANMFLDCSALVYINFIEGSIKKSISFAQSTKLSLESAKSILLGLYDYSGTDYESAYTITLPTETWALLDADGETSPTGTTWAEYVVDIGWNK